MPTTAKPDQAGRAPLPGSERPRPASHKLVGPVNPGELIAVSLILRPRPGSPPLPDLAHWHATPLGKRRFLTIQEYGATYGAHQDDVDRLVAFVTGRGMTVLNSHAGRRAVAIQGTAAQLNVTFGVTLNLYEGPLPSMVSRVKPSDETVVHSVEKQTHHGYDGAVQLPVEIADIVVAVVGLDDRFLGVPGGSGNDPSGATAQSVPATAQRYNFPNTGAADQTIGIVAPQPAASPGTAPVYLPSDINSKYFPSLPTGYTTAPATIQDVNLTVGTTTYTNNPSLVTSITSTSSANNAILELTQDISTSATIAQGATVNVYFTAGNEQGWLVFLNRVLVAETENQPTVVSSSFLPYLGDDSSYIGKLSDSGSVASLMTTLFQQVAALGINLFYAQGDWGADGWAVLAPPGSIPPDGSSHVSYFGTDPWVTSCGGTVLGTSAETVWSDAFSTSGFGSSNSNFGTTGGGVSATFPTPPYQSAAGITGATDSAGTVHTGRGVPDVAAMVSYTGFFVNGLSYGYQGTSCVAPFYAGLAAVLRSAFGVELGVFNSILYQLKDTAFNDITKGNNDSNDTPANVKVAIPSYTGSTADAPFFTAGAGWDACTGLGSIDGTKLLNGIAALMYNQTFYFRVEKSTFGLDEVSVTPSYPAFSLVLEGFTPSAVAGIKPSVGGAFALLNGVTITVGDTAPELPTQVNTPQRIFYPCTVAFTASAAQAEPQGIFPTQSQGSFSFPISALMNTSGQPLAGAAVFQLVAGADPHFANFNAAYTNAFYLSEDLRVFTVTPGINGTPIGGVTLSPSDKTNFDTNAGYAYIQTLLNYLNLNHYDAAGTDAFTLFPEQSNATTGDSSVTPTSVNPADATETPFANYNFAVARVRLNGPAGSSSVKNVRVFFRLFTTETSDTDYVTDWTYPSNPSSGLPAVPLLGVGNPPVTIPFFATGNYESNSDFNVNVDYSANSVNNQPITVGASAQAWAYYGCYLNIFPTKNTISGHAVQALLPGTHHCIVAQIAFDDAPIINANGTTENPASCDKLAQRNLQITLSDNPGPASTHRIPQTFDLRRGTTISATAGDLLDYPDELMVDWGNTPVGSTANIYWPQVNSADVLALAKSIYSTHQLSAADANTVQCKVPKGFTYVPIPAGIGENFAGLFTIDLPAGVVTGQVFTLVVRRIATRRSDKQRTVAVDVTSEMNSVLQKPKTMRNWRYIVGTFAVRIPVTTGKIMRPLEENTLAIMKWRLAQWSPGDRWYPILLRYIDYISKRVDGVGGNSSAIQASPWGAQPPPRTHQPRESCERYGKEGIGEMWVPHTGKVTGLTFDHFGDFEGFELDVGCGVRFYHSREKEIERLAERAWRERLRITVWADCDVPQRLQSIVVRDSPVPFV
jgi:hypothetical protein